MLRLFLFAGFAVLAPVDVGAQVSAPLNGYAVRQPLGESMGWVASVANAGHPKDVCLVARESGRVWSMREKFVWQAYPGRPPRNWVRIEVYGDSTLIEDRDPERREERWVAVVLSDSVYNQLSRFKTLNIKVKAPYRPASVTISLQGFNTLKDVFDQPVCAGR